MRIPRAHIPQNKADITATDKINQITSFNGRFIRRRLNLKEIIDNANPGIQPQKERKIVSDRILSKILSGITPDMFIRQKDKRRVEITSEANERIKQRKP